MPFFSIVIPVYNRAALFRVTLETVLAQTFADFEIVIVDDGSVDDTAGLVKDWMQKEARIRYVYQQNSERGRARNNGIRHSEGRYVVLFDSDDYMHPDYLATLHEHLVRLDFPDFIAAKYDFVRNGHHRPSDILPLREGYYDYKLFLRGNPMACNVCFKNKMPGLLLFEEDRKYAMLEDWMFFLQNLRTHRIYIIDKVTVSMNDHESRSMNDSNSLLVSKAALALVWMRQKVELSASELKQLEAQVNYFSAIHCYLDGLRKPALRHLAKALGAGGFRPAYAALFVKTLIGRKWLLKLKS